MGIFDVTTTDIPFYDKLLKGREVYEQDIKLMYEIKKMTPNEFMVECSKLHQDKLEDEYKMVNDSRVSSLLEYSQSNKLPLPFLNYVSNLQEGRHRAVLCMKLNISEMPVMIITESR